MSELALYRKYRPSTFEEVLGQKETIALLRKEIDDKSISHAYLFSGGRGTGKTTVARIFATAVGAKPSDIYEMDAASNRSIDDIRALREAVLSMPFESPYKVYIIDEAHMLTKEAWNALLKTLEEPPAHVIFILATTDKEKVPDTIISRCQSFVFREPSLDELKHFVIDVAKKEKTPLDGPSSDIIALFGDGSYRDTLSVLEKVLISATAGKKLDVDMVARIVGAPTNDLVNKVLLAIEEGDVSKGLEAIRRANDEHVNMEVYLRLILEKLRITLMLRYDKGAEAHYKEHVTEDDMVILIELARSTEKKINSHVLSAFLEATRQIGFASAPSLPIELALIKTVGENK